MSRTYKDAPDWVKGFRELGEKPPRNYRELTNSKQAFSHYLIPFERWDGKVVNVLPSWLLRSDEYKEWAAKYRRHYPYRCDCWYCLPEAYREGYRAHVRDMIAHETYDDILSVKKFRGRIKSRGC